MAVNQCMALETESDKVFFDILAGVAAELFVIDFQIRHRESGDRGCICGQTSAPGSRPASASSATSRFNLPFSFSSSFSRFAWSIFKPPYSFRQR